jgi:hypothetical protein
VSVKTKKVLLAIISICLDEKVSLVLNSDKKLGDLMFHEQRFVFRPRVFSQTDDYGLLHPLSVFVRISLPLYYLHAWFSDGQLDGPSTLQAEFLFIY